MLKLLREMLLFCLPFVIMLFFVIVVDPFDYYAFSGIIAHDKKAKVSYKINYALWKLIEFSRKPTPNILLGDSRMNRLKTEVIKKYTQEEYYNFSYGNGTLEEICKTFWFSANQIKLKNVYIGLNLNLYNLYISKDRVNGALSLLDNPLLYLINRDVIKASIQLVKENITQNGSNIEKPEMSREQFWDYQLDVTAKRFYSNYAYPENYYEELKKISDFCKENKIKLVFIILPTHFSLQKTVLEYNLLEAKNRFIKDVRSLGDTFDYDYFNNFTKEKNNL